MTRRSSFIIKTNVMQPLFIIKHVNNRCLGGESRRPATLFESESWLRDVEGFQVSLNELKWFASLYATSGQGHLLLGGEVLNIRVYFVSIKFDTNIADVI